MIRKDQQRLYSKTRSSDIICIVTCDVTCNECCMATELFSFIDLNIECELENRATWFSPELHKTNKYGIFHLCSLVCQNYSLT